jgi:FixJ family two-component response regulator
MNSTTPVIFVIDDDLSLLKALSRLLRSFGFNTAAFSSPQQFLEQCDHRLNGCIILDFDMPYLNGLELQQELAARGSELPIIFLTGHGDIPMSVRAMKQGAIDFLTKPVDEQTLIEAINGAIEKDRINRENRAELSDAREKLEALTPREREVLTHVVAGRLNKQIAADLGTVEKTIKVHRAHLMAKLKVRTLADLVRLADKAGVNAATLD